MLNGDADYPDVVVEYPHLVFFIICSVTIAVSQILGINDVLGILFFCAVIMVCFLTAILYDDQQIRLRWTQYPDEIIHYTRTINSLCFIIAIGTPYICIQMVNVHDMFRIGCVAVSIVMSWICLFVILGKMQKILFS